MTKTKQIEVQGAVINLSLAKDSDYICITDMANAKNRQVRAADIIKNWIRTRATLELLGTWEQLVVLSNLESINALLIEQGLAQKNRLVQLNKVAIMQIKSLLANESFNKLVDK